MLLRDCRCVSCGNVAEDLGPPWDVCAKCGGQVEPEPMSYAPTQVMDPVMRAVMMKGATMRKKVQGRIPWRKSSWSQTD